MAFDPTKPARKAVEVAESQAVTSVAPVRTSAPTKSKDLRTRIDEIVAADTIRKNKIPSDDYDRTIQFLMSPRFDVWESLANRLRIEPLRTHGYYLTQVPEGWRDKRTGTVITFDTLESLLVARIAELNVDLDLMIAWICGGRHPQENIAFDNLPFDEQIKRFRKVQS
jgi:hypothetical protein